MIDVNHNDRIRPGPGVAQGRSTIATPVGLTELEAADARPRSSPGPAATSCPAMSEGGEVAALQRSETVVGSSGRRRSSERNHCASTSSTPMMLIIVPGTHRMMPPSV